MTKKIVKDLEYLILKVLAIIISTIGISWYKEKLAWLHKFLVELFIKTEKNGYFVRKNQIFDELQVKKTKSNAPDFFRWEVLVTIQKFVSVSFRFHVSPGDILKNKKTPGFSMHANIVFK